MGFGEAIGTGFRKYVTTRGRASRSEYWYWTLFSILATVAADIADAVVGAAMHDRTFDLIGGLLSLALFLPGIAVSIRRMHDLDRSGWWNLLPITVIGIIPYLIWLCSRGTQGANGYGLGSAADVAGVFGDGSTAHLPQSSGRSGR